MNKNDLLALLFEQGMMPLYFHQDVEVSINVLRALYAAGIRVVEYTNRGEAAFENFKKMRKLCDTELKGIKLGTGTIKNANMAQLFIDAGADFIVCPALIESVAFVADKYNMLWIPGCMTSTEILQAEILGASLIKVFPGNVLGPSFVASIKEIYPNLNFMPTGGVELHAESISAWFKAGVSLVGMGSKLITKQLMEEKNYYEITETTKKVIEIIRQIKNEK